MLLINAAYWIVIIYRWIILRLQKSCILGESFPLCSHLITPLIVGSAELWRCGKNLRLVLSPVSQQLAVFRDRWAILQPRIVTTIFLAAGQLRSCGTRNKHSETCCGQPLNEHVFDIWTWLCIWLRKRNAIYFFVYNFCIEYFPHNLVIECRELEMFPFIVNLNVSYITGLKHPP